MLCRNGVKMKCTYRDEYLFHIYEDWKIIVSVIFYLGLAAIGWTVSWPLSVVFITIAVIHVMLMLKYNLNLYYKAMEHRKIMMTKGIRYMGKIVDAGGRVENHREYYYDNSERKRTHRDTKLANYWIEAEYFDNENRNVKRSRSENFEKKTQELIGKNVEVYVYNGMIYMNIL